jgi:hypothetical protein
LTEKTDQTSHETVAVAVERRLMILEDEHKVTLATIKVSTHPALSKKQ